MNLIVNNVDSILKWIGYILKKCEQCVNLIFN